MNVFLHVVTRIDERNRVCVLNFASNGFSNFKPAFSGSAAIYLSFSEVCQSLGRVAELQRGLPGFTLRHAAETYTAPVKDWPSLTWSHRRANDELATRVTLDSESQTADTITTVLFIGHQSPNLTQVRHTFRRQGSAWTLLRREEGPEIRI